MLPSASQTRTERSAPEEENEGREEDFSAAPVFTVRKS